MAGWPAHAQDKPVRVGLIVKALGIGFFDAAHKGAEEAAKELGNVEVIYTGPTTTTAERTAASGPCRRPPYHVLKVTASSSRQSRTWGSTNGERSETIRTARNTKAC